MSKVEKLKVSDHELVAEAGAGVVADAGAGAVMPLVTASALSAAIVSCGFSEVGGLAHVSGDGYRVTYVVPGIVPDWVAMGRLVKRQVYGSNVGAGDVEHIINMVTAAYNDDTDTCHRKFTGYHGIRTKLYSSGPNPHWGDFRTRSSKWNRRIVLVFQHGFAPEAGATAVANVVASGERKYVAAKPLPE